MNFASSLALTQVWTIRPLSPQAKREVSQAVYDLKTAERFVSS
jgi:hypothetical protein